MPLYYFKCNSCGKTLRKILKPEEADEPRYCLCTNGVMVRDPHPPSSRVTEVLDNGAMTRSIERLADAERLFSERNEANKKSRGEK